MKKSSILRRVINYTIYTIFGFIAFCVLWVVGSKITTGEPSLFGYYFYSIKTSSMEPTLPVGSIILTTKDDDYSGLSKGTIITFRIEDSKIPNTHRIVGYYYQDSLGNNHETYDYDTFKEFYRNYDKNEYKIIGYKTQGDNPSILEPDKEPVLFGDIECKFVARLSIFENVYNFLVTPFGFIAIIFIPSIFVVMAQFVSYVLKKKETKMNDEIENELKLKEERLKEEAIKEYLESIKQKNE